VVETISTVRGSTGWCVMISGGYGQFAGLLPPSAATEIFSDPAAVLAGTFRPNGVARAVAGRYQVSGQGPLASGSSHATRLLGGCRIVDGDQPRLTPAGGPELRLVFLPVGDGAILDTWHTAGLRGTASHDFVLRDRFIPAHRTCWFTHAPARPEPLYRLPTIAVFAAWIAAVPLGIARHAIAAFTALAGAKTPTWSQALLREKAAAQLAVGQAEGLVRAGRAFLTETIRDGFVNLLTVLPSP
jgi:alkylation response protein AidB-like acyl-CoA dehydrogenase